MKADLFKVLKSALVEKDVENAYRNELIKAFDYLNAEFSSKYGTDGVLKAYKYNNENIDLILLLECKFNENLKDRTNAIKVLIQAIYYLKMFEKFGDDLPHVVMVGDVDECFCLHTNDLIKYLASNYVDWSIAPSAAPNKNPQLLKEMYNDEGISPYVFEVNEHFDFKVVVEKAIDLSKNVVNFIRITEKNINRVFQEFVDNVLYSKKLTKQTANELVNIFMSVIINPGDNYIHPNKPQTLMTKDLGSVRVYNDRFKAFFRHFQRDYSPREKDELVAICDRLIEDTSRRFKGEFFTPTEWVEEAHRMIEAEFGMDWKDKYVVWDPAWGTGNLTRDYKFKELYCSTINEEDIGIANQRGYNPEAIKFQFDFLNDPDEKLPEGLRKALAEGRPIIVFMNPPYGQATEFGIKSKADVAKNRMNVEMVKNGLGKSAQQLYAQFLYRIAKAQNDHISIALFSPPLFITGGAFEQFRKYFMKRFKFCSGYLINSNNFADVKSWGLNFTLWNPGQCGGDFIVNVMHLNEHRKPYVLSQKILYNTDNHEPASTWARKDIKDLKTFDCPQMTSAINVKALGKTMCGRLAKNSIGYLFCGGNSVYTNSTEIGMFNNAYAMGHGFSVLDTNFNKSTALFAVRKLVTTNWINQKDEYLAPNTEHPDYKQWNNDCLIYSLFNNSSNQSALRGIEYKGKNWDIINEWFWMSIEDMRGLAEKHRFDELYSDCRNFGGERFVFKRLPETELSDDAAQIYNKACELVKESFQYRELLHLEHPEYHLNAWDAGWYQIKLVLKKFMPEELKEFRKIYKTFEDRMREGVYKFGFLK